MLGQCMLPVIADMVNRMPIPGLMKCKASDYAESHSSKYRHASRHLLLCAIQVTYCQNYAIAKPDIGGLQFCHQAPFFFPGCNAFCYIAYNTHSLIHKTTTIVKRLLQHCPKRSSRTTVCFANSVISP